MAITYKARVTTYTTISGDLWDLIAYVIYGDEHCCHALQDANYEYRFVDKFGGDVEIEVPQEVTIDSDVRGPKLPDIAKLQPWR